MSDRVSRLVDGLHEILALESTDSCTVGPNKERAAEGVLLHDVVLGECRPYLVHTQVPLHDHNDLNYIIRAEVVDTRFEKSVQLHAIPPMGKVFIGAKIITRLVRKGG